MMRHPFGRCAPQIVNSGYSRRCGDGSFHGCAHAEDDDKLSLMDGQLCAGFGQSPRVRESPPWSLDADVQRMMALESQIDLWVLIFPAESGRLRGSFFQGFLQRLSSGVEFEVVWGRRRQVACSLATTARVRAATL